MPDTEDIAIFVRVVELGSLTAAGRDMRLSVAVVSNRIARLESRLGARLLNRTTRRVQPTPEGALFYEHSIVILNELEQAESVISERTDDPRGPIRVTVPAVFGRMHVAPYVPAFLQRYPNIHLRLHLSDQFVDLIQERMDLAIRIAELGDSNAIARKLADNRRVIVGGSRLSPAPRKAAGARGSSETQLPAAALSRLEAIPLDPGHPGGAADPAGLGQYGFQQWRGAAPMVPGGAGAGTEIPLGDRR